MFIKGVAVLGMMVCVAAQVGESYAVMERLARLVPVEFMNWK